ncbi:4Fe-4S dicluster domain-containing protein, partial [Candidatus Bathyarchaeota archaeon]|nr:4Fe-4S dicluster domain-containing protein [Candidatus Bathyarchaeota archaeon]NIR18068.1 4Fe-4S dicluster domain-containing protein [Desulfobacterales bacterium]NIU81750.1 4Fe-4S dicluster domain-containing protein [Candidatus Bathyarchaeota archaeon]NIV67700.1 4Fe-4S dicluster domain-containing protein [Candidatus Bathyarchaeota archaeon]NIW16710.1 4Fe-4S dicluster domain-containing protein [Candidatus Bathyarchaeota archaeon]
MKLLKTGTDQELTIERVLHAKSYALTLNKTLCTGCGICVEACPREAMETKTFPKVEGGKTQSPTVQIDEEKCHYCGICDSICPFGAIDVMVDGQHLISVVERESFPQLIREIEVDATKCDLDCTECEEACPLELIQVNVQGPSGKKVQDVESWPDREELQVVVDIDRDLC